MSTAHHNNNKPMYNLWKLARQQEVSAIHGIIPYFIENNDEQQYKSTTRSFSVGITKLRQAHRLCASLSQVHHRGLECLVLAGQPPPLANNWSG
jgi:hypothetical protein